MTFMISPVRRSCCLANLRFVHLLLVALMLGACASTTPEQQTFVAQNAVRSTAMSDLRVTAAVEVEQRQITLEYLIAVSTQARQRQDQLVSTLNTLGIDASIGMNIITPAIRTQAPFAIENTATAAALASLSGGITRIPPTPDFRTAPPDALPTQSLSTATIDINAPGLASITLSTGVNNDNCPIDNTTQFFASTPEIYANAITRNIQAGSIIGARWFQDGVEAAYYDITAEIDLTGTCIYIFVDQSDFPFTPGSEYSIAWEINGQRFDMPLPFTVVDG